MSSKQKAYLITIGEPLENTPSIMTHGVEESLVYSGRLIERLHKDENYKNRYVYIVEHVLSDDGNYVKTNKPPYKFKIE